MFNLTLAQALKAIQFMRCDISEEYDRFIIRFERVSRQDNLTEIKFEKLLEIYEVHKEFATKIGDRLNIIHIEAATGERHEHYEEEIEHCIEMALNK